MHPIPPASFGCLRGRHGSMARLALRQSRSWAQSQVSRSGPLRVWLSLISALMQWLGHCFLVPLMLPSHAVMYWLYASSHSGSSWHRRSACQHISCASKATSTHGRSARALHQHFMLGWSCSSVTCTFSTSTLGSERLRHRNFHTEVHTSFLFIREFSQQTTC